MPRCSAVVGCHLVACSHLLPYLPLICKLRLGASRESTPDPDMDFNYINHCSYHGDPDFDLDYIDYCSYHHFCTALLPVRLHSL